MRTRKREPFIGAILVAKDQDLAAALQAAARKTGATSMCELPRRITEEPAVCV